MKKIKLIIVLFLWPIAVYAGLISPKLNQQLQNAKVDQDISCIVLMKNSGNAAEFSAYQSGVARSRIMTYKNLAQKSQVSLLAWLGEKTSQVKRVHPYWVVNAIHVVASPAIIQEIGLRDDVDQVFTNDSVHVSETSATASSSHPAGVEWNIRKIEADKCWAAGYNGEGVIVGFLDSGADILHPALAGKWSGHWFVADGLPKTDKPYDDFFHGTHVAGIIAGGDGLGPSENDIGVAPGAKFAVGKVLDKTGGGEIVQFIQGIEYMAGLKDSVNIRAVSCSWNNWANSQVYWDAFKALRALGILVIISNGNSGARGTGTVQTPADYPFVVGVGNTDNADKIASTSSLGPATQKAPYNDMTQWIRKDWNFIKPNISAPGENVRSSVPNGEYKLESGTSMAAPHVLGAVALICQKNPNLTLDMLYDILMDNVDIPDPNIAYPNNTFGWGRLNVYKMLQATPVINKPRVDVTSKDMTALVAGQSRGLILGIKNQGGITASNTVIRVVSNDNYIEVQDGSFAFGNLTPQQVTNNSAKPFKILAHALTPPGHEVKVSLIIHADGPQDSLDFQDTVEFSFTIGTPPLPYVVWEDDFEYGGAIDSFATYWDKSGNWARTTAQAHSTTHAAFSGAYNSVNSITLKNGIDLSNNKDLKLSFWDKSTLGYPGFFYEMSADVSTNGGTSWTTISPATGSHEAGTVSKSWTATELSLSEYSKNTVKIRFTLFNRGGASAPADWYVDDIKIYAPTDNEPPYFSNTTIWNGGTVRGPFAVQSTITDRNGIKSAVLNYRIGTGAWIQVPMQVKAGALYAAEIPAQSGTGTVSYFLEATDTWPRIPQNMGAFPVGSNQQTGFISFDYGTTGIVLTRSKADFTLNKIQSQSGLLSIKFSVSENMQVKVAVYAWSGRNIGTLLDQIVSAGQHSVLYGKTPSEFLAPGIYYVNFTATPTQIGRPTSSIERVERFIVLQ